MTKIVLPTSLEKSCTFSICFPPLITFFVVADPTYSFLRPILFCVNKKIAAGKRMTSFAVGFLAAPVNVMREMLFSGYRTQMEWITARRSFAEVMKLFGGWIKGFIYYSMSESLLTFYSNHAVMIFSRMAIPSPQPASRVLIDSDFGFKIFGEVF